MQALTPKPFLLIYWQIDGGYENLVAALLKKSKQEMSMSFRVSTKIIEMSTNWT